MIAAAQAQATSEAFGAPSEMTPPQQEAAAVARRRRYLRILSWVFAAFNSIRVLTYLPTVWAVIQSGQSGQHSLFTWVTWVGANASMAAWLYENNGGRLNKAIAVNIGNTIMCVVMCIVICWYR